MSASVLSTSSRSRRHGNLCVWFPAGADDVSCADRTSPPRDRGRGRRTGTSQLPSPSIHEISSRRRQCARPAACARTVTTVQPGLHHPAARPGRHRPARVGDVDAFLRRRRLPDLGSPASASWSTDGRPGPRHPLARAIHAAAEALRGRPPCAPERQYFEPIVATDQCVASRDPCTLRRLAHSYTFPSCQTSPTRRGLKISRPQCARASTIARVRSRPG